MIKTQTEYRPDHVSPPGETLLEILTDKGISQADLATRMGRPVKTINEIVKGKAIIMPETALQLEKVLGVEAAFWMSREQYYQEHMARLSERDRFSHSLEWLKSFPIKQMTDYGWIKGVSSKPALLDEMLSFFGVASIEAWNETWENLKIAFRRSAKLQCNIASTRAWLRKGELDATEIQCAPYDETAFTKVLGEIRNLTNHSPDVFIPQLREKCAATGVATVFVHELPRTPICGATRWLNKNKALIQLSLRYKTNDHLWFTFFHEAGHILLHGKKEVFIETEDRLTDVLEEQADNFASKNLITDSDWNQFTISGLYTFRTVGSFANRVGIAPGIVVGRLQHENKIPFSFLNRLKQRLAWSD